MVEAGGGLEREPVERRIEDGQARVGPGLLHLRFVVRANARHDAERVDGSIGGFDVRRGLHAVGGGALMDELAGEVRVGNLIELERRRALRVEHVGHHQEVDARVHLQRLERRELKGGATGDRVQRRLEVEVRAQREVRVVDAQRETLPEPPTRERRQVVPEEEPVVVDGGPELSAPLGVRGGVGERELQLVVRPEEGDEEALGRVLRLPLQPGLVVVVARRHDEVERARRIGGERLQGPGENDVDVAAPAAGGEAPVL